MEMNGYCCWELMKTLFYLHKYGLMQVERRSVRSLACYYNVCSFHS